MAEKSVLVKKTDSICTLTLNRPQVMNAVSLEMIDEALHTVYQVAADSEIKVVIIEGAGGNFCTGADMTLFKAGGKAPEWLEAMKRLEQVINILREMPQPIITKVRGMAVGGGANLALTGDFVIAAESAQLCEIFVNIGLVPDCGGIYFLPRLVGMAKARELALLGNMIDGKNAASIGLIYKCVPDEKLDREVDILARSLLTKCSESITLIKQGLNSSFDMTLKDALAWEAAHQAIMGQGEYVKKIAEQFFETRGKSIS
jgi:enoyl-CoA hydratase/carnithine racemase